MSIVRISSVLSFLLAFSISLRAFSQDDNLLKLELEMKNATADTARLRLLIKLSADYSAVDPHKGIKYGTRALRLADELGDIVEMSLSYANITSCYNSLNNSDSAIYNIRKAQVLLGQIDDAMVEFKILTLIGNTFIDVPNVDSAMYYYTLTLDIAQEQNDKAKLAAVYNNLGLVYSNLGLRQESYEYYIKALDYFEATNDLNNQAITLNNIGIVNQNLGNDNRAINYLLKAAEINQSIGDSYNLSMNYSNIGVSYKVLENFDKALEYYNKSSVIAEKYGFVYDLARNSMNMGNVYAKTGDTLKAIANYEKSLKISREQGILIGILLNNLVIAEIIINKGSLDEATELLNEALVIIEETKLYAYKENYYKLMSLVAEKSSKHIQALKYYKKYQNFKDSALIALNKSQLEDVQEKYETEKKTLENQQLRELNQANARIIQDQRILGAVVIMSMILAMIYAVSIFRSRRKLKSANQILQDLNNELSDKQRKLEESNQTKDKMFSVIGHDLRGPFSLMMGYLQMITEQYKDFDDAQKLHMLIKTYEQSLTTYGLLENLLQWSLLQQQMVEYNPQELNLFVLTEDQLDVFESPASNKNLNLENKIAPQVTAWLDENMMKTIVRNLIGNAVKFTPKGGNICISSLETENGVAIKITDTGVGMPAKTIQGLIGNGRMESTKGTEKESGTGLGLEIVKDFANRMQIKIKIESMEGKGTVFTLLIPKGMAHP
jgi:signal transduction histidine kinase